MPLTEHIAELRVRLTRSVLAIVLASILSAFFYDQLFDLVVAPFDTIKEQYEREGATVLRHRPGLIAAAVAPDLERPDLRDAVLDVVEGILEDVELAVPASDALAF